MQALDAPGPQVIYHKLNGYFPGLQVIYHKLNGYVPCPQVIYHKLNGYPVSTWAENLALLVQQFFIVGLIWRMSDPVASAPEIAVAVAVQVPFLEWGAIVLAHVHSRNSRFISHNRTPIAVFSLKLEHELA